MEGVHIMCFQIFNGFTLKMIMVVFMFFDHIAQFIPNSPYWLHWLGRLVAPIFFFLLTEGYVHTRDSIAYMKRLFTWSAIMFFGNAVIWLLFRREFFIINNIFFSMALGIALLINLEKDNKNNFIIFIILFLSAFAEGSIMTTAMVLIFHYLKKDKIKMSFAYIAISAIFLQGGFTYENLFVQNPQWMMVFALPLILMYNGKRGPNIKYFFYIFYPLHIWILYIIGYFMDKLN